jgi:hypothetical protein
VIAEGVPEAVPGEALQQISQDPEIEEAMFDILEVEKMIEGKAQVTLIPKGGDLLAQLLTLRERPGLPPVASV